MREELQYYHTQHTNDNGGGGAYNGLLCTPVPAASGKTHGTTRLFSALQRSLYTLEYLLLHRLRIIFYLGDYYE
jgi:hypothetical protein